MAKAIHQIFLRFDQRVLDDYPLFAESKTTWENMAGWTYKLWDDQAVEALCKDKCPQLLATYGALRYPVQRVDLAKYMIAHHYGGLIVDLDILPLCHADAIIPKRCAYLFDRCSRKHVIANDFFYVGGEGPPGICEYFVQNLVRVNQIDAYKTRKMRYVFHTSGPDFFTRYLKQTGLDPHRAAISDRIFAHAPQRNTYAKDPRIRVLHQLSWVKQLDLAKARVPKLPGQGPALSRKLDAKGRADLAEETLERRVVDQLVRQSLACHERLSSNCASECDSGSVVPIPGTAADTDSPHTKRAADGDAEAVPP